MRHNGITLGPGSPLLTPAGARRHLARSEADDQKALVELLLGRFWEGGGERRPGLGLTEKHPELLLLYAINPNRGGQRSKAARGMAKAMGQLAGMPDLCLPVMRGPFLTLYVEMKRSDGRVQPAQRDLHERLTNEGHCVLTARSVEEGAQIILGYLALPWNRPSVRPIAGQSYAGSSLAMKLRFWRSHLLTLLTPSR